MSSHTNKDEAAGAPLWSVAAIRKSPTSANRTDLFNDTTADNFQGYFSIHVPGASSSGTTSWPRRLRQQRQRLSALPVALPWRAGQASSSASSAPAAVLSSCPS